MSAGIAPSADILLSKEETVRGTDQKPSAVSKELTGKPPRRRGLFTLRQLNVFAVMTVLLASGMVSIEDFAFVLFSGIYMFFISKVAFPQTSPPWTGSVFGDNNRTLRLYMFAAAVVGLFLPIAYICEGIFEGDKEGIKAAAPHLFFLCSQVFMEGVASTDRFSLPVRIFVPVCYNARRMFTLEDWVRVEISKVDEVAHNVSGRRLYVGRALAVANTAFWGFNLFGFLLPVYLPKALKIYYSNQKHKD